MKNKIKLCIVTGGRSGEHEVSLVSAWNIFNGLDKEKYTISLIGIGRDGNWRYGENKSFWIEPGKIKKTKINSRGYNTSCANIGLNRRTLERAVELTY